jgi:trehalose-6-phosphatase
MLGPEQLVGIFSESSSSPGLKSERLFMLDLEGTIWDRNPRARSNVIPDDVLAVIGKIVALRRIKLWLFSGLSMSVLRKALGNHFTSLGLWYGVAH